MSKPRILISNDDGVYAEGIKTLARVLAEVADVTVVAPLEERSTTGHTLTLDHPLRVVQVSENTWGCSGYPADCALMGIAHLMADKKPDLVVSGINRGANMGQDIYYSGTVAAAREATFHGIPSIAVSSVLDFLAQPVVATHYETAALFIRALIVSEKYREIAPMHVLNVNVPNLQKEEVEGFAVTRLGFRRYSEEIRERKDFRDRPYYWVGGIYKGHDREEESDCHAVDNGRISVTPLNLLNQPSDETNRWSQIINELSW